MTVNSNDIIRVTATVLLPDSGVGQNVWHYKAGAGVSAPEDEVMDEIRDLLDAGYAQLNPVVNQFVIPQNMEFSQSSDNGSSFAEIGERVWITYAPSGASEALPPQDAFLAHYGASGTGKLGSKYLAGFSEAQNMNGVVQASAFIAIVQFVNTTVLTPQVTGGFMLPGWVERPSGVFRQYNGTASVPTRVATQRRRKDGVGI